MLTIRFLNAEMLQIISLKGLMFAIKVTVFIIFIISVKIA